MKITEDDWQVVEAYMSDIHPSIRNVILPDIRKNEEMVLMVAGEIADDLLLHALLWCIEVQKYIETARQSGGKPGKRGGF